MELTVNKGKMLAIETSAGDFDRYAIRTHFIEIGEDLTYLVERYVVPFYREGDILTCSEKIVSLCQGRVVYKSSMKLSRLAEFLSRFASHSSAGVGVDCPWKMQYAIDYYGSARVLFAAICAGIGKLFGKRGIFYKLTGEEIECLDGFYGKAFDEYEKFGIQIPKEPEKVCRRIYERCGVRMMIIDANDITQKIFGACAAIDESEDVLLQMIRDNPAGQSAQQTPFVLIRRSEKETLPCDRAV